MRHLDQKILHRTNLFIERGVVSNVGRSKAILVVRKFEDQPVKWQRINIGVICDYTGNVSRVTECLPVDDLFSAC